jgi:DNA-binding GntR family transcriptional regulator
MATPPNVRRRRLVRTKTSAAVVSYVLEELFDGRLKSGDRIELDAVCAVLGVSRIPVREAMVMLERDGIVSTKYHGCLRRTFRRRINQR